MPYLVFIAVYVILKCEMNLLLLLYTKEHNALSTRSELPFFFSDLPELLQDIFRLTQELLTKEPSTLDTTF